MQENGDDIRLTNLVWAGIGQAILRLTVSTILYFVAGAVGLLVSFFWGISVGRRSKLAAYPVSTGIIASLATGFHGAILVWAFWLLDLSLYPFGSIRKSVYGDWPMRLKRVTC